MPLDTLAGNGAVRAPVAVPGVGGVSAVTPGRRTVIQFDHYTYPSMRQGWFMRRKGEEVGRGGNVIAARFPIAPALVGGVVLMQGGTWILDPLRGANVQLTTTDYNDAVLQPSEMGLAAGVVATPMHRPSPITTMGQASFVAAEAPAIRKTVPLTGTVAGDWSAGNLAGSQSANAPPPDPLNQTIPMDRVMEYGRSFMENTGFGIQFHLRGAPWWSTDALLNFHFGGAAPATGSGFGGAFSVQIRGNGTVSLFELNGPPGDQASWAERMSFRWAEPHGISDTLHHFTLIPIGKDHICFASRLSEASSSPGLSAILQALFSRPSDPTKNLYIDAKASTGHEHTYSMTGRGPVRLDARRDFMRGPVALYRLKYPGVGTLVDGAFSIDGPMFATDTIYVHTDTYKTLGGNIVARLFSANTGVECAGGAAVAGSDNFAFTAIGGESDYFCTFDFTADTSRYATPVLYGYSVEVPGFFQKTPLAPTLPTQAVIQDVTITGTDLTPDHETASLVFKDLWDEVPQLHIRDRIPTVLSIINPVSGAYISHLFEGITFSAQADWRGKIGNPLASESYRAYDPLRLVGQWAVLADKVSDQWFDFRRDPNVPNLPWKVVDAIRWLLVNAGVPDYEIDVPDDPLRLFPSPTLDKDTYIIQPGVSYTHILEELCLNFMGRVLVRDPNAGPYGMWRLLPPQPTEVLCNFYLQSQPGFLAADPAAYPGGTFATRFRSWVKAPDFNYLAVTGVGDIMPGNQTRNKFSAWKWNPNSFNWPGGPATANPLSPDYTDGTIRARFLNDAKLVTTPEAAAFLCNRIFELGGHGERWASWTAPLYLVTNVSDSLQMRPRPMRINDTVYFPELGQLVIVRSCNPIYSHDAYQMADYEGKIP